MKLGDITWSCDRCLAEAVRPAKNDHIPVGWQTLKWGDIQRDMCPKCINDFRNFWYTERTATVTDGLRAAAVAR